MNKYQTIDNMILQNISVLLCDLGEEGRLDINENYEGGILSIFRETSIFDCETVIKNENPDMLVVRFPTENKVVMEFIKYFRQMYKFKPVIVILDKSCGATSIELMNMNIDKCIIEPVDSSLVINAILETAKKYIYNTSAFYNGKNSKKKIDDSMKVELNKMLRCLFSSYLKSLFGVGPRKVDVQFETEKIVVKIYDALTPFERNLMSSGFDTSLLGSFRFFLYSKKSKRIESAIKDFSTIDLRLVNINVDVVKGFDELTFAID